MRKKASFIGRARDYLLVAAVYCVVFLVGWLFSKAHFDPSSSLSSQEGAASARVTSSQSSAAGDRDTGKLVVFSPGGCRYAEFNNGRPEAFAVTPADCDLLVQSLDPAAAAGGQATSRIEAIGKYFRHKP